MVKERKRDFLVDSAVSMAEFEWKVNHWLNKGYILSDYDVSRGQFFQEYFMTFMSKTFLDKIRHLESNSVFKARKKIYLKNRKWLDRFAETGGLE